MTDVDPIIAQDIIVREGLDHDTITEKIFLSPLAEKQWREDFSSTAQASKIFVLYLSSYNLQEIYVSSFINENASVEDDIFSTREQVGENRINYCGMATRRFMPEFIPASVNSKVYDGFGRTFHSSDNSVFLDAFYPSSNIDTLHYSVQNAFREIAAINMSDISRDDPGNFFTGVSDVVVDRRTARIEEQEVDLNNRKKAFVQAESLLKSSRDQFAKLTSTPPAEQLESQIRAIQKFPAVKSVKFTDKDLIVYTNMLDIGVTDKNYDDGVWADVTMPLGEFEIKFQLEKIMTGVFETTFISFLNLTQYRNGYRLIHPHVQGSPTNACLSQWSENFIQAGHNFSVIGLVSNAINYLRTFNPEDEYGRYIFDFPGSDVFEGVCEGGNDYDEYDNGDYDRPGYDGEWQYYENRDNGEFRRNGWEWYEEEVNGEFRNFEWLWYDEIDSIEGDWDGTSFYWYEDNDEYIRVDGEWLNAADDDNYVWDDINSEWINAEEDEDYYQVDNDWIHIDEIEEMYASEYTNNEQELEVNA